MVSIKVKKTKVYIVLTALLFTVVIYTLYSMQQSGFMELIRPERAELYVSSFRVFMSLFVLLSYAFFYDSFILPINAPVLLPTNLFLILFCMMVLPGALFTSDFYPEGIFSFYGHLVSLGIFLAGATIVSCFDKVNIRTRVKMYSNNEDIINDEKNLYIYKSGVIFIVGVLLISLGDSSVGGIWKVIMKFLSTGQISEAANTVNAHRAEIYYNSDRVGIISILSSYSLVIVLPVTSAYVALSAHISGKRLFKWIGIAAILCTIFLAISTGSRLRTMYIILFYMVLISQVWSCLYSVLLKYGVILICLLFIQTATLGRMQDTGSTVENMGGVITRLTERVFMAKGRCSKEVFEYFPEQLSFKHGVTYLKSLSGKLAKGPSLANEMFELKYGSKGTAGPQAFAEGYANFGFLGMGLSAFLLGILVHSSTLVLLRRNKKYLLDTVFWAYITILLARSGYGNFFTFKSNGLHILLLFWLFYKLRFDRLFVRGIKKNKGHKGINSIH